jgi:hypothetical protein
MKNCVVVYNNERTEFVNNGETITITQIEDNEPVGTLVMIPEMAESLKKNLLADQGAVELPL